EDVEFGKWDPKKLEFVPLSGSALSSADAVRVTGRRTQSRGTATPLIFARILGRSSSDLSVSAVARLKPPPKQLGVVGLDFATLTDHGTVSLGGGQSLTLPAGNHVFTSLSMSGSATLKVSGAVKLYVRDTLTVNGNSQTSVVGDSPANLEIYVLGTSMTNLGK